MTHDERVYHHLYVDSKSPLENAERIAELEELVLDLWTVDHEPCRYHHRCKSCTAYGSDCDCKYFNRMRELGIEVEVSE